MYLLKCTLHMITLALVSIPITIYFELNTGLIFAIFINFSILFLGLSGIFHKITYSRNENK